MSEKCCVCKKNLSNWLESNDGSKFCSEECFKETWPKCYICRKPMDSWTESEDGKKYCSENCYKKSWPICAICGNPMDNWTESEDGKKYCSENCYKKSWPICEICGKPMERWIEINNGNKYCDEKCFEKSLPKCVICNMPVNGGFKDRTTGDIYCTEACYEKSLPNCQECGKHVYSGIVSDKGSYYCSENCYKKTLPTCSICGKPMKQWTETEDGNKYCSDQCFIKSLPKCATCGKPMKRWIETEDRTRYCNDICFENMHQPHINENAISIDTEAPLTPRELSYLIGLDEEECSRFMEISNLDGDEALEAIDIYMQSLNNDVDPPAIILSSLRSAKIHTKLANRLGSYNTMRGGVEGYKGFVFEELHGADAASRGTAIEVLGDNSIADFIVMNKDGTKTYVQAKAGYHSGNIDFSKYKGQKIVVDKGNTVLAEKARKAGLVVEESNVTLKEADIIARAQQLESKITGLTTAPVTTTIISAHKAGVASAKLAAKVAVGFNIGTNIFDLIDGEKSFSEATVDTITAMVKVEGCAYIGGAACSVVGGSLTTFAGTAVGTMITGAATTASTAVASTAIGGAIVGGIGTVTTATATAVTAVAAAPLLPVLVVTAVGGFAYKYLKKNFT